MESSSKTEPTQGHKPANTAIGNKNDTSPGHRAVALHPVRTGISELQPPGSITELADMKQPLFETILQLSLTHHLPERPDGNPAPVRRPHNIQGGDDGLDIDLGDGRRLAPPHQF